MAVHTCKLYATKKIFGLVRISDSYVYKWSLLVYEERLPLDLVERYFKLF